VPWGWCDTSSGARDKGERREGEDMGLVERGVACTTERRDIVRRDHLQREVMMG